MAVRGVVKRTLFSFQLSRMVRGAGRKVKEMFVKTEPEGSDPLAKHVVVETETDVRIRKCKSSALVLVATLGMSITQIKITARKQHVVKSPKFTALLASGMSITSAFIWYRYMEAAEDELSPDDVDVMLQMVNTSMFRDLGIEEEDFDEDAPISSSRAGLNLFNMFHGTLKGDDDALGQQGGIWFEKPEDDDDDEEEDDEDDDVSPFSKDNTSFSGRSENEKPSQAERRVSRRYSFDDDDEEEDDDSNGSPFTSANKRRSPFTSKKSSPFSFNNVNSEGISKEERIKQLKGN